MAFTNGPPWPTRIHSVSQARSCTRIARPAGTAPITHDGARIRTTHDYESFFLAPGSADASASHEHLSIRRTDRKSVVSGKRGSVSVELGGRRNIKKKNQ